MSERIVTDSRGQRWDVIQHGDGTVFRHQSGDELRAQVPGSIDELSTEQLLDGLTRVQCPAARHHRGRDARWRDGGRAAPDSVTMASSGRARNRIGRRTVPMPADV